MTGRIAGVSILLLAAGFLAALWNPIPSRDQLDAIQGRQPGFVTEAKSTKRAGTLRFSGPNGETCTFNGPNYGEVRARLQGATEVTVLCATPNSLGYRNTMEIIADGVSVLSYEDAVNRSRRENMIGVIAIVSCVLAAAWMAWGLRKSRKPAR